MKSSRISTGVLEEVVRRIVDLARPERIVLFGSAARGQAGPKSDLDLLVVKGGLYDRSLLLKRIYMNMRGVGAAVDVVVVTPDEVEWYGDVHALVIKPALREGRDVYCA